MRGALDAAAAAAAAGALEVPTPRRAALIVGSLKPSCGVGGAAQRMSGERRSSTYPTRRSAMGKAGVACRQ